MFERRRGSGRMELCKEAEEREEYESIGNFEMYFPGEACGLGVLVLQLGLASEKQGWKLTSTSYHRPSSSKTSGSESTESLSVGYWKAFRKRAAV